MTGSRFPTSSHRKSTIAFFLGLRSLIFAGVGEASALERATAWLTTFALSLGSASRLRRGLLRARPSPSVRRARASLLRGMSASARETGIPASQSRTSTSSGSQLASRASWMEVTAAWDTDAS